MKLKAKNRLLDTDMVIYQDDEWFKFSLDSVLLANFVTIQLRTKKIMDLATGNAPIPLLLTLRTKASIYGVEFQSCVFELAKESVLENGKMNHIQLLCEDVRNLRNKFSSDSFDVVTCNPPYFKTTDSEYLNDNSVKALARHEITLTLDDVLRQAKYLLKNDGMFAMVHRTERLVEILEKLKEYRLEPKKIQFIYPKKGRDSDLFLIEAVKNGKPGLKMLSPLIVHEENGEYTKEISKILKFDLR